MQQRSQRQYGPLPTIPVVLSVDEQGALEHLCRSGKTEHRVATRARAILLAADGWPNEAIARHLGRHHTWVRNWRRRFAQDRLAGPGCAGRCGPCMTRSCAAGSRRCTPRPCTMS